LTIAADNITILTPIMLRGFDLQPEDLQYLQREQQPQGIGHESP